MHPCTRRPIFRLTAGLLIALATLLPMAWSASSASAQENGLASITIYSSLCPPNYQDDDYYDDCYDTPAGAGIDFTLTDLEDTSTTFSGTSGPSGFAAIEGIDEDGFYQLSFDVPFSISSAPGSCSEDGNPFQVGSEYQMTLTTDNDIRCDIFISPASDDTPPPAGDGSVTVYLTACEPGYSGSTYYQDCYDNPLSNVTLIGSAVDTDEDDTSADSNGNGVAVLSLGAGTWDLFADIPGDFLDGIFVYCSLDGDRYDVQLDGFSARLAVEAGADIRCDWYIVPTDARAEPGTVTIYNTLCPAGYSGTAYYPDCYNNPVVGAGFSLGAFKLDYSVDGVTNGNGSVTLPLSGEAYSGSYTLSAQPLQEVAGGATAPFVVYCTVDGKAIDVSYNLVQLDPGGNAWTVSISPDSIDDVRCDWYTLQPKRTPAPSPTPIHPTPTVPVTQLPNTGVGEVSGSSATNLLIGIAVLSGSAAIAAGAWLRGREQRFPV